MTILCDIVQVRKGVPVISDTYRTSNESENEIRNQERWHTFMNRVISSVAI